MKVSVSVKRLLAAAVAAVMMFLTACGPAPAVEKGVNGRQTVTDGAGRVLNVPEDIGKYSISSVYAVSVPFIVALGLTDRVAAINVKSNFWKQADANLAKAGTVGRGSVDLEGLAWLAPTVLIHRSNDPETVDAVTGKLGIDVFCITVENLDDIKNTLTALGAYFGKQDRAKEVCNWIDAKFAWMNELTRDIPQEERKTALLMGGKPGRVAGSDMLQSWMIEQAGGICVSETGEDHNWVNAGAETVFMWDPDVLFLTASTALEYDSRELMEDPVWSGMKAIRSGRVYQMPARLDGWDMPGISCVLGTMYMLHCMYPERLDAETLMSQVDEYYTMMFGRSFSADEIGLDDTVK